MTTVLWMLSPGRPGQGSVRGIVPDYVFDHTPVVVDGDTATSADGGRYLRVQGVWLRADADGVPYDGDTVSKVRPSTDMVYVNAYLVSRMYGGPEEGGWWYDAGEPLESRFVSYRIACRVQARLLKTWVARQGADLGRYQSIEVRLEENLAARFPASTPRYE